jgi:hypothetical protein
VHMGRCGMGRGTASAVPPASTNDVALAAAVCCFDHIEGQSVKSVECVSG